MKIELLAPAGSYQMMKAAFSAGADAVYIGGEKYGARAYAENLNKQEMLAAIDYAHLHDKKLYLTVNTLLKNDEIKDELCQYLAPFYERGIDAVIVQDLGVLKLIKETYPKLAIHASTQMTITGSASAKLLKKLGVSRIVLPRELSLEEIADIHTDGDIEVESFVHGALCYSYSGQCLFSSFLGGRSGNRGRCAGPCRLPYSVNEDDRRLNNKDEQYLLSPKDICTVKILPEIIAAGVTSLKIEGRMKKPEYTAGVVRIYRKYLDILADRKVPFKVDDTDYQELMDLYNRDGFSQGYYKCQNGPHMMAMKNEKVDLSGRAIIKKRNEELIAKLRGEYIEKEKRLPIVGRASLRIGEDAVLTVSRGDVSVTVHHGEVQLAMKQPVSSAKIREQLNKTGDSSFYFIELEILAEDNIFIAIQSLNELRRKALLELENQLLKNFIRTSVVLDDSDNNKNSTGETRDIMDMDINKSRTNVLTAQVETQEQLESLYGAKGVTAIYASVNIFLKGDFAENVRKYINDMKRTGKAAYLSLAYVIRDNSDLTIFGFFNGFVDKGLAGFLVHNIEGYARLAELGLANKVVLDYQVYTFNQYAKEFWVEKNVKYDTVSPELNFHELKARDNRNSEMIIYGYALMMISAQCLKKNVGKCTKDFAKQELIDRYHKKFIVKCDCDFCYNVIYNSIALGLIKEHKQVSALNCHSLRLAFTTENGSETKTILNTFVNTYQNDKEPTLQHEFTKGHFKRGIE